MITDFAYLLLGFILACIGGEFFVRGSVGIAHWARISPGIIGATVAAFGTSSPELSVAINSGLTNQSDIALGDALGSNLLNVALILGITLCISGIQSNRESIKRDFPSALLIPIITAFFAYDGVLSRIEAVLILLYFVIWLTLTVIEAKKQRDLTDKIIGEHNIIKVLMITLSGLAILFVSGKFIVTGAGAIAISLGIDKFIVGAIIVAIGTSTPELATTVIAKLKGHDEVGLGTIIGSNIFNGGFIVSVSALISPIVFNWNEVLITLIFGVVTILITYPYKDGFISRKKGFLLLAIYVFYIFLLWQNKGTLKI